MPDRYPGYDVLKKRQTPSWNEQTRRVIDARLAVPREPRFLTWEEFATLAAVADRIVPQPKDRAPIPVAALVDHKLFIDQSDGFRQAGMPREREAYQLGLKALDEEARQAHGTSFRDLAAADQDALIKRMQEGNLHHPAWGSIKPDVFFKQRLGHDIVFAYYSHPTSWNEIGWGGPASPRGYVRTGYDDRDPWEPAEAVDKARKVNRRV